MNKHAEMIDVYMESIKHVPAAGSLHSSAAQDCSQDPQDCSQDRVEIKIEQNTTDVYMETQREGQREKSIIEEIDISATDPFHQSLMKILDGYDVGRLDVDILLSTLEEIENANKNSNEMDIKIKQEVNEEVPLDAGPEYCGYGKLSVFTGPYMRLTIEETNRLQTLIDDPQFPLKMCGPSSLYHARVG